MVDIQVWAVFKTQNNHDCRRRREIKMCEYCKKKANNKKIKDIDNDKKDFAQVVFLREPNLYIELDAVDNDGYKACDFFEINYCPMCGRRLS